MIAHPDKQARAQAELDAVVGRNRMPTFADYPHLHYIRAMVKEILRWAPVAPLGLSHQSIEDDWYEGMSTYVTKSQHAEERISVPCHLWVRLCVAHGGFDPTSLSSQLHHHHLTAASTRRPERLVLARGKFFFFHSCSD
jgi:Cytochrome P450